MDSPSLSNNYGAGATEPQRGSQVAPGAAPPIWPQEAVDTPQASSAGQTVLNPGISPNGTATPQRNTGSITRSRSLVKTDRRTGALLSPTLAPRKIARWWAAIRPETFSLSL